MFSYQLHYITPKVVRIGPAHVVGSFQHSSTSVVSSFQHIISTGGGRNQSPVIKKYELLGCLQHS